MLGSQFWVTGCSPVGSEYLLLFSGSTGGRAMSGLLGVESHSHHHMERCRDQSEGFAEQYSRPRRGRSLTTNMRNH